MEDRILQLRRSLLFRDLSREDIQRVAELVRERSYHRGSTVYRQGDVDTTLYIIVSGRLRVLLRNEHGEERVLNYLETGDSFGERSLVTDERRNVTVDVLEDAVLLRIEKRDFDRLLNGYPHLHEALGLHRVERLRRVPLFEKLPTTDIKRCAELMGRTRYRGGCVIYSQGEPGITFYIIDSGRVEIRVRDKAGAETVITHLEDGDFLGERSLLTGEPRDSTARALEDTSLFYLNKTDFDNLLRQYPAIGEVLNKEAGIRELMLSQSLPWQREDEVLVALSHRHIYAFLRRLWLPIVLLLASIGIILLAVTMGWTRTYTYAIYAFLTMCLAIAGIAVLLVIWFLYDWRNDYFAVTNKRVVHVEKVILIRESRDEAPLERIQDIFILTPGILANLLRFNDLSIQTAGAGGSIVFRTLGNAAWVRDRIFEQMDRLNADERAEDRQAIRHRLKLALGQIEHEMPPTPAPEEAQLAAGPEAPSVTGPQRIPPAEVLQGCLRYLIPKERLEEDGVVTWRKHWFILIYKTLIPALLAVIMLQLAAATLMYPSYLSYLSEYQFHCLGALLFGLVLSLFFLWYRYEDWRNDIYQLTDDRIIDIDRLPLGLREERREASLDVIQDIRYIVPGIMANLLDYGSVVITTAGREAVFAFDWVHHPRRVQEEIFTRMEAFRERERQRERERRAVELLDWFSTYQDLAEEQDSE